MSSREPPAKQHKSCQDGHRPSAATQLQDRSRCSSCSGGYQISIWSSTTVAPSGMPNGSANIAIKLTVTTMDGAAYEETIQALFVELLESQMNQGETAVAQAHELQEQHGPFKGLGHNYEAVARQVVGRKEFAVVHAKANSLRAQSNLQYSIRCAATTRAASSGRESATPVLVESKISNNGRPSSRSDV